MKTDPIEELRLRAYPNPERKGCPGAEVIRALANKEIPHGDPMWDHIWHCSPCFSEFKVLRDARRKTARKRFSLIATVATTGAAILLIAIVLYFRHRPLPPQEETQIASNGNGQPRQFVVGELDYRNLPAERSNDSSRLKPQVLGTSTRELSIVLPSGSEAGNYAIEILRPSHITESVANYEGKAMKGNGGMTTLRAHVDFSTMTPGRYVVAWRRTSAASWDYGPFVIK